MACRSTSLQLFLSLLSLALVCQLACRTDHALADDFQWIAPPGVGASWNNPINWVNLTLPGPGVPGATDSALFSGVGGFHGVVLPGVVTIQEATIASGFHDFAFLPGASLGVTGSNQFIVGQGANPALLRNGIAGPGGAFNTNGAFIGFDGDSNGTLELGAGASLVDINNVIIGQQGAGYLDVAAGASLSTTGWLIVGNENGANGSLIVNGSALASDTLSVGDQAGGIGDVTVSGAGAQLVSAWTLLGHQGDGSLTIENGGLATTQNKVSIGDLVGAYGELTVTGAGSILNALGWIDVGSYGEGDLHVTNGGMVTSTGGMFVGAVPGAIGRATVEDAGSQVNVSWINVGSTSFGSLTVESGGVASSGSAIHIGDSATGDGEITVMGSGSELEAAWYLAIGDDGEGSLVVSDGGSAVAHNYIVLGAVATGTGEATITGAGSSLTADWGIAVGDLGQGTLVVEDGATVSVQNGFEIGNGVGGTGEVTVSGAGSSINCVWGIVVGNKGVGTLNVENGGTAISPTDVVLALFPDSEGTANIQSGGTLSVAGNVWVGGTWGQVGDTGTLNVNAGGIADINHALEIGHLSGSVGKVNVVGAGAQLETGWSVQVGNNGDGSLTVNDGGTVVSTYEVILGNQPTGVGEVTVGGTGASSSLSGTYFNIGQFGKGTMTVEAGGLVSTEDLNIATEPGSQGTVTINEGGTISVAPGRSVFVGGWWAESGGTGTLTVNDGAVLNVGNELRVYNNVGNSVGLNGGTISTPALQLDGNPALLSWTAGKLHLTTTVAFDSLAPGNTTSAAFGPALCLTNNRELEVSGNLTLGGAGDFRLTVNSGSTVKADNLIVTPQGELHGGGVVDANVQNSGLVAPGSSPGTLDVTGDFLQTTMGETIFELTSATSYDVLDVGGQITLGGKLSVLLGFSPVGGEEFDILDFASLIPDSPTLDLPPLSGLLTWDTSQLFSDGLLSISDGSSNEAGDFDVDGDVDGRDFLDWQRGDSPNGTAGGPVSAGDLADWQSGYDAFPLTASATAVPEPASAILLTIALLASTNLRMKS